MPDSRIPLPRMTKFEEATRNYRIAFERVHDRLRETNTGRVPPWCFALDRMNIEDVASLDPVLARLEHDRRRWRAALHSLAEYIALKDEVEFVQGHRDPVETEGTLDTGKLTRELDRFITVLNRAKNGGVIYVNGTFEPVTLAQSDPSEPPTT